MSWGLTVYLLRKQPPQRHCYIWISWWAHCLSLSQPSLFSFACGLAQMNYSSVRWCRVSSFRCAEHKESPVCPSKGLELSLPFTHPPLSGARSCSDESDTIGMLSSNQMRRRLQSAPQPNMFSCLELNVSHPWEYQRTAHPPMKQQLLWAAWVSASQTAAQAHLH